MTEDIYASDARWRRFHLEAVDFKGIKAVLEPCRGASDLASVFVGRMLRILEQLEAEGAWEGTAQQLVAYLETRPESHVSPDEAENAARCIGDEGARLFVYGAWLSFAPVQKIQCMVHTIVQHVQRRKGVWPCTQVVAVKEV